MLQVENLTKDFSSGLLRKNILRAVDKVSFAINQGEIVGLVGESGSGKSTLGRLLLMLLQPTAGDIFFDGTNLTRVSGKKLRSLRREMQIIFQHPEASLNPRMKIYQCLAEPLRLYNLAAGRSQEKEKIMQLIHSVGLLEEHLSRYPHELSGGQVQRAVIARVLALKPKFVVADEPTSMLDVSVQAQILQMLKRLRTEYGITFLLISHDFDVIRAVSDRIGVMYKGKLVELGTRQQVVENPQHPYTKHLTRKTLPL
jgi:ABC-type oligopeptide transport system ATPase subunit